MSLIIPLSSSQIRILPFPKIRGLIPEHPLNSFYTLPSHISFMVIEFIPSNNLRKGKNVLKRTNIFKKNFDLFKYDLVQYDFFR
jgi:hypothetical protein